MRSTTNDKDEALAAWIFIRWMLRPDNQVKVVEKSGTFPLSNPALAMLDSYKVKHPVWAAALQYLPLAQNTPMSSHWGLIKEMFSDISWKLIQFTTDREDIPTIFQDAQNLLTESTK